MKPIKWYTGQCVYKYNDNTYVFDIIDDDVLYCNDYHVFTGIIAYICYENVVICMSQTIEEYIQCFEMIDSKYIPIVTYPCRNRLNVGRYYIDLKTRLYNYDLCLDHNNTLHIMSGNKTLFIMKPLLSIMYVYPYYVRNGILLLYDLYRLYKQCVEYELHNPINGLCISQLDIDIIDV